MLKRAHKGTFHKLSPKHLDRYVQEFAGRHNLRERDHYRPDGYGCAQHGSQAAAVSDADQGQRAGFMGAGVTR